MSAGSQRPMFSAIVPVYNHAQYVAAALDSIIAQTFNDWEAVVVDDGSTDESGRIAEQYAARCSRIRVIHQKNSGLAAARNTGIRHARGVWLALLDSDDLWLSDALESFATCIRANPEARLVYGYYHRLTGDGRITKLSGPGHTQPTGAADLFMNMFLNPSCVCMRRDLLEEVGLFDENLRLNEDYELFLRIGLKTRYWPVNRPTTLRRRHEGNLSRQSGRSRLMEIRVLERFLEHPGRRALLSPEQISARLSRMYYTAGRLYFRSGYFERACQILQVSLKHRWSLKSAALRALCSMLQAVGRKDPCPLPDT